MSATTSARCLYTCYSQSEATLQQLCMELPADDGDGAARARRPTAGPGRLRVIYTFDAPPRPRQRTASSVASSLFAFGGAAVTMLRHSISSVRAAWGDASIRIRLFTNTPDTLRLYLVDAINSGVLEILDASAQLAAAPAALADLGHPEASDLAARCTDALGVANASADEARFAAGAAGHARVVLIPLELRRAARSGDAGVLYLDNDTTVADDDARALRSMLSSQASRETCLAFEREIASVQSLLVLAAAKTLAHVHPPKSCDTIPLEQARVVNNGVQWYPSNACGFGAADDVMRVYSQLPSDVPQRYLHDMVALSIAWSGRGDRATLRGDSGGGGGGGGGVSDRRTDFVSVMRTSIDHYWAKKARPERHLEMLRDVISWRLYLDADLSATLALSARASDVETVLQHAEEDSEDLLGAARRAGLSPDSSHAGRRHAMRAMARVPSKRLQPGPSVLSDFLRNQSMFRNKHRGYT